MGIDDGLNCIVLHLSSLKDSFHSVLQLLSKSKSFFNDQVICNTRNLFCKPANMKYLTQEKIIYMMMKNRRPRMLTEIMKKGEPRMLTEMMKKMGT